MLPSDFQSHMFPPTPGVYLFKQKSGVILYIGKAKNIKKRIQQYFSPKSLRKQEMVNKAHHIDFLETKTEEEAILLETNLIWEYKPLYNNLIKWDTAYVYIKIPKEPYPRILLSRYKKNDGAIYIGPKVWKKQLKQSLQVMRTLLLWRVCAPYVFKKWIVCSDYFFWLCKGWCVYQKTWKVTTNIWINTKIWFHTLYAPEEAKRYYDEIIKSITRFFHGDTDHIKEIIQQYINDAVKKQNFERAAKLRDIYHQLSNINNEQNINLPTVRNGIFVYCFMLEDEIIRSILKLYQGKIIDIIVWKNEGNFESQIKIIEREYNISLENIEKKDTWMIAHHLKPKKISAKEKQQLKEQCIYALSSFLQSSTNTNTESQKNLLQHIQKKYHLHFFPHTIECTDISHFWWENTVGSIVCAQWGVLYKWWWRKYKIHSTNTWDDYKALEELITKRFTKIRQPRPDLFILDGGKWQLQIIKKMIKKNPKLREEIKKKTEFVALGKGRARAKHWKWVQQWIKEYLYSFDNKWNIIAQWLSYDIIDRLLIQLRDEAHRFANNYRKKYMEKTYRK